MSSIERLPGREHFPRYPKNWIVLRIFQLVFSIITIGLCAYSISIFPWVGTCVMLFTALVTFGISIWLTSAHSCAPRAFNYWAVLAFDLFLYIFWLVSFALVAVEAAASFAVRIAAEDPWDGDNWWDDNNFTKRYFNYGLDNIGVIQASILAATAGIGALEFLFFFISWVTDAVVIHRHRKLGLHCKPLPSGNGMSTTTVLMQPQGKMAYEPVPQQFAFAQQETEYNPQQMYAAQQQGFAPQNLGPAQQYSQQQQQQQAPQQYPYPPAAAPLIPQQTGGSHHHTASPASSHGPYPAPYDPQTAFNTAQQQQQHQAPPYQ